MKSHRVSFCLGVQVELLEARKLRASWWPTANTKQKGFSTFEVNTWQTELCQQEKNACRCRTGFCRLFHSSLWTSWLWTGRCARTSFSTACSQMMVWTQREFLPNASLYMVHSFLSLCHRVQLCGIFVIPHLKHLPWIVRFFSLSSHRMDSDIWIQTAL